MNERSPYDRPIDWNPDGTPSLWDSDTFEGGKRIARRHADAEGAETALSSGALYARLDAEIARRFKKQSEFIQKVLETAASHLGKKFAEERQRHAERLAALETEMREVALGYRTEIAELKSERDALTRDLRDMLPARRRKAVQS